MLPPFLIVAILSSPASRITLYELLESPVTSRSPPSSLRILYRPITRPIPELSINVTSVKSRITVFGLQFSILSSMPLNDLAFIIASQDVKSLSKVKGLGKKTAERIILELRENISSLDLPEGKKPQKPEEVGINGDAVIALMSLGFTRSESEKAVQVAVERGADTIESIITVALQTIR